MKSFQSQSIYFLICCLGSFLFSSCGGGGSSDSGKEEIVVVDDKKLEDFRNQLNEVLLQEKKGWKDHWSEALVDFSPEDFELFRTDTIDPMEMPERNPILQDNPLFNYQFPHPDGNGVMDIYSYKIEAHDAVDRPFLNPDSEVAWYRGDGMKERLLFMGPSGMFEEGIWLDPAKFLVLGYFHEEAGFRPMAWLIDVESHVLWQFQHEKVAKNYVQDSYLNTKIRKVEFS